MSADNWARCPRCRTARLQAAAADAEWSGALLGQMRWPGDPDHAEQQARRAERKALMGDIPVPPPNPLLAATGDDHCQHGACYHDECCYCDRQVRR